MRRLLCLRPSLFVGLAVLAWFAAGCFRNSATKSTSAAISPTSAANDAPSTRICTWIDAARPAGIDFTYQNGASANHSTILESLGGGVAWLDYDRDGWLDLLATGGGGFAGSNQITGRPCGLFRSLAARKFVPVAVTAGIESTDLYTHGIAIGDYDNDGFPDALITGYGRPQLWRNMGDGSFFEVGAPAGIDDSRWGSSAGWADLNGDGFLDLYIAHYVNWSFANHPFCMGPRPGIREICPPRDYEPLPDVLYFSEGDGTFVDVSATAGLCLDGKGLGVLLCDVEPDGDVDIYVANDTTDNFLYINGGAGKFAEEGVLRGVALDDHGIPNGSMGIDLCDYNRDGLPDLWVANYEHESFALYRNEGAGHFLHVSQRLGITDLGGLFVGFGTACEDFDADGDQDFLVANGHVLKYPGSTPRKQQPLLIEFNGKRFQRARFQATSFFEQPQEGRGLAAGDYDRDGDIDVVISRLNEPIALLDNRLNDRGQWISLRIIGSTLNRDAVGARVAVKCGGQRWERQIAGGGSYLSHSDRDLHFTVPMDAVGVELTVHWPSGNVSSTRVELTGVSYTLVEPRRADEDLRIFASEVAR